MRGGSLSPVGVFFSADDACARREPEPAAACSGDHAWKKQGFMVMREQERRIRRCIIEDDRA